MSLVISKKYKYIFFHLPKNAGVSISRTLISQESILQIKRMTSFIFRNIFQTRDNFYYSIQKKKLFFFRSHITCGEFYKLMENEPILNYLKFAVIRNPWDRMVSRYFYSKKISDKFKDYTFKQFVDYDIRNNLSIIQQYNYCCDDRNNFCLDKVIKFENLNDDFNQVCSTIYNKKNILNHFNQSEHKKYQEYYDLNTKNKIYNTCKKDIDFFEYEF